MVRPKIFGRPGRTGVSMNENKYAEFTRGQEEDLLNKMGGLEGAKRFQSGELVLVERNTNVLPSAGFPSFNKFDLEAFLASWDKFYRDVYKLDFNAGGFALPSEERAMGSGGVMARSITIEQDLAEIKKRTKQNLFYRYTNSDIDQLIQKDKEAPRPTGSYAIWTAPAIEATEQAPHLAKKSYDDIQVMNVPVMNFAEYARFFLWHLWATGQPLDRESCTLTGSLDADGDVLGGCWLAVRFHAGWFGRGSSSGSIRFRQVVLPPLS